ncbi:MAG: polysaccharide deacetylase family protein [Devosia sp.]
MIALRMAVLALAAAMIAGCQSSAPQPTQTLALAAHQGPTIRAPQRDAPPPARRSTVRTCGPSTVAGTGALAGRTIEVGSISDIKLGRREVVLTFDDGPRPGPTDRILDTLDSYGVKATFLVVGRMASAHPAKVRKVARRGHTIGTHTQRHPNLARMGTRAAHKEIALGDRSVARALSGSGYQAAPFFRFPYLADTRALRRSLARRGVVVLDVDIDSKDYLRTSPARVRARTLAQLRRRGRGVILFHDIHARTASMLPSFLAALKRDGYKVVHLVPKGRGVACPQPAS